MWKSLGVVGLVALSVLMLVPSVTPIPEEGEQAPLPEWYTDLFDKRLVLGLDLQGGIHLHYKVDVAEALSRRANQTAGSFEATIKEKLGLTASANPADPTARALEDVTTLTVEFANADDAAKFDRAFLDKYYPTYELADTTGAVATVTMSDEAIETFRSEAVEKSIETVERRINEFGVAEPNISRRGESELVIQLPGVKEEEFGAAKEKLAQTGQLRFQIVDRAGAGQFFQGLESRIPQPGNWPDGLDKSLESLGHKTVLSGGTIRSTNREILDYVYEGQVDKEHLIGVEEIFVDPGDPSLSPIGSLSQQQEDSINRLREYDPDADIVKGYQLSYLFSREGMSGENVIDAYIGRDQFNRPVVQMQFDQSDADEFYEMTKKFTNELMAIMIDEIVFSAPRIKEPIPGGRVQIELSSVGGQALKEAAALVAVLKSGALQAPLRKMYDSQVGPTLGADSVQAGQLSVAVGFILVIVFMALYYKAAGLVADMALMMNVLFVLACLTAFGATLTLPGIAGIVLTIGMAVDANVLVFERVREELRKGVPVRKAIDAGYEKAFSAIFDANVTTAIAAIVLYQYGSGPIRGFAVTLAVGIVCSVFTALVVTRLVFDFFYGRGPAPAKMSI